MTGIMQMFVAAKSAAVAATDAVFNFVTLLLNTNSTNNSTNNAILYSSSNGYTGSVTRNGNVTQGTYTPFSPAGWSCAFSSGNNNFITVADNSTLRFGSANFTIEAFVYRTAAGVLQTIACKGTSTTGWNLAINSSNQLVFTTATSTTITSTATLAANTWHYVAVVRTGTGTNQTRLWINGTGDNTGTVAALTQTTALVIGVDRSTANPWDGYLSNIRLSSIDRNVSVVPTTSLTYDANTIFLGLHTNRFQYVSSSNAFVTMTPTLSPVIEPFSPFAPVSSYSVTDSGGSSFFDGSGDYLSFSDATELQFGTGQFTINCWVYRVVGGAIHPIASKGTGSTGWNLAINASSQLVFTHGSTSVTSTATVPLGTWAYISVVRTSTGTSGTATYINASNATNFTCNVNFTQTNPLYVGASRDVANTFYGYIAGFEYIKGSAITPSSIPTAPPTTSNSPALLLNFTNAGIYDVSTRNDLETVGDAKVSTTQAKFGTTSMFFDGTGDALAFWAYPLTNFVSNDFTVEFWMYITANPTTNTFVISAGPNGAGAVRRGWGVRLHDGTTASLSFVAQIGGGSQSNSFGSLPSTNAWHHIAFSRNGSSMRCFVDGTQLGSTWTIPTLIFAQVGQYDYASISGYDSAGAGYPARYWFSGYLDEVRITNGNGRYTANFTAPTEPFPVQ
jgi:hypothetical protein